MIRATALIVLALGAAALAGCVSELPGGTLGEPTGGSDGGGGTGGSGGRPPPGTDAAVDAAGPPTGGAGGIATGGAGGMATGAGGGPSMASLACGPPSAAQQITNFDEVPGGDPMRFGMLPGLSGGTFARPSTGAPPTVAIVQGDNGTNVLRIGGTSGSQFFDGGLTFDTIVDAKAYTHVRFTIQFLAPCGASFGVLSPPNVSTTDDPRGTCTGVSCPTPLTSIYQNGTVCAPILGTMPVPVDPSSLIGLVWKSGGACAFTIDDIALVRQ
jgi:hypothetical protein